MKKYLYLYQIEKYESGRFLKRIYKYLIRKHPEYEVSVDWDLKSRFILYYSIALFIISSTTLALLLPYYVYIPIIVLLWMLRFFIIVFAERMYALYEKRSNSKRYDAAKQKINAFSEVRFIGIAGGSGKTSVKKLLKELLGEKTAVSQDNDEQLNDLVERINQDLTLGLENFLVEMNAHKLGSIKKMCELTRPRIGILLNIDEQHLERYKKIENTIKSKFELLNNLTEDGVGIVNLDNTLVRENLEKVSVNKLMGFTLENNTSKYCEKIIFADKYTTGVNGSKFLVNMGEHAYEFETRLVGKKHISNLLGSISCAVELGYNPEQLIKIVSDIDQISGRMEVTRRDNIYVIDNSMGSNVDGFRSNLEFLSKFDRKKVVVTPGIYEIGEKSKEVHKMLGFMISKVADLIILLGESHRTESIRIGALDNDFDKNKIIRVKDLDEVFRFVDKNLNDEDAVLLENDLDLRFL